MIDNVHKAEVKEKSTNPMIQMKRPSIITNILMNALNWSKTQMTSSSQQEQSCSRPYITSKQRAYKETKLMNGKIENCG